MQYNIPITYSLDDKCLKILKVECGICGNQFNINDIHIEEYEGVKYGWCGKC